MAKALKVVGTVVAVVALAATGLGLALAPGAFALGLGTAGMLAVGTFAGLAAGVIGLATAVFAPKPSFSTGGNPQQFQTNPQSGLPYPIGRTRMSGVRIHADTYDAPSFKSESKQDILSFAVLLGAGGPMEEIETFRADKETVTFDPSTGNAIGGFSNFMAQKVSLGIAGASALALAFGGANFPGWSSAHKLSGISHALWDLRYDSKGEKFGAGVPEPEWIGKWAKIYDPRKDSTYPGGSGSHRALDETTYEWSRNPALHGLTWALGRWQNGEHTIGMEAPIANIRVADFVEAANVADANDWYCGGVEWSTDSKWAVLKRMLQAGGAEPTMTGAMIGCRVNTPRISIATVRGADLLDGLSIAATRSRRDRFNTAIPRYRSEDHEWEVISGTPVSVPDYVTQDGGVRTKEIDLPLVQAENVGDGDGNVQAGQLVAYEIVNSREAGPWRFTTGPKFLGIKTGDCITLDVPDEGIDDQPVIVREVSREPATLKFTFVVETETEEKHDFALGSSTTPPPTWSPTPPDLTPPQPSESLWSATPILTGEGLPALVVAGACEFPGADAVLIEYRKVGDADWVTVGKSDATQPVNMVIAPLEGATEYEVRLSYQSENRFGDWLVLDAVTTDEGKLGGIDDGATRNVYRGDWAADTDYVIGDYFTYAGKRWDVIADHTSTGSSPPPNANVQVSVDGGTSATYVTLYQRSATVPSPPSGDVVFDFATSALAGDLGDWTREFPAGTDIVWQTGAPASSTDMTATIPSTAWYPPEIYANASDLSIRSEPLPLNLWLPSNPNGGDVATTYDNAEGQVSVFNQGTDITGLVTFAPDIDSGNITATINTADNTPVSGKPKGWIRVTLLTGSSGYALWTATIGANSCTVQVAVNRNYAPRGQLVAEVSNLQFDWAADGSGPADPDQIATISATRQGLSGGTVAWTAEVYNTATGVTTPIDASDVLDTTSGDVVTVSAAAFGDATGADWAISSLRLICTLTIDGVAYPGYAVLSARQLTAPGVSSQLIKLYKRTTTSSAPAVPDNDITYTFADNTLTGSLDGWATVEPSVTAGPWSWETFAWATGTDPTFVITPSDWRASPNLLSVDDYRAETDATGFTVPAESDGTVDPAYFAMLEGQLYFRTSSKILVGPTTDTAGVTLSLVSDGGGTAVLNTATNTPTSGKPKGYFKITALESGATPTTVVMKATYGGNDYVALPVVVTKAIAGESAIDLRVTGDRTNISRDAFGRISPASQTTTIEAERVGFPGGTTNWTIQDGDGNYLTPVTDYLSAATGDSVTIDADKVEAAAGSTRQVTIWASNGTVSRPWSIQADGLPAPSDNLWPDPQLNTGDRYWPVAAAAPWFLQTDGASIGYQFKNYIWLYTSGSTSEVYLKVIDGLPVRSAGEIIYLGFTGGRVAGTATFAGGVYVKWYDSAGVQIGSAAKVTTSASLSPSSDWPQINGQVQAPSDAATFEIGYVRNSVGTVSAASIYMAAPYAQRTPPDANNTEARQAFHRAPATIQEIPTSVGGTVKSYPKTLNFYRFQGSTDVTSTSTWSITPSTGISATIGSSTGVVSITEMAPGYIDVSSTRDNLIVRTRVFFVPTYDPEPQAMGTISADNPSASQATISSTSYGSANIGSFVVKSGATGFIEFFAKLVATPSATGSGGVDMKPRYRTPPGSGTWIDSGLVVTAPAVTFSADNPVITGSGASLLKSGLSANTDYEIDFLGKMTSGSTTASMTLLAGTRGWARGL